MNCQISSGLCLVSSETSKNFIHRDRPLYRTTICPLLGQTDSDERSCMLGPLSSLAPRGTGCDNRDDSSFKMVPHRGGVWMKTRLVLISLVFLVAVARAQDNPQWELFGGFQYTRFNTGSAQNSLNLATQFLGAPPLVLGSHLNLSGWNLSLQENRNRWIGGVIDFSGNYVTKNFIILQVPGTTDTLRDRIRFYTFMAGPQVTMRRSARLQPFARALFGGAHLKVEDTGLENGAPATPTIKGGETGFAMGGGGGVDIHLARQVAVRVAGDYIRPYLGTESEGHLRVSAGVTFRVGSK